LKLKVSQLEIQIANVNELFNQSQSKVDELKNMLNDADAEKILLKQKQAEIVKQNEKIKLQLKTLMEAHCKQECIGSVGYSSSSTFIEQCSKYLDTSSETLVKTISSTSLEKETFQSSRKRNLSDLSCSSNKKSLLWHPTVSNDQNIIQPQFLKNEKATRANRARSRPKSEWKSWIELLETRYELENDKENEYLQFFKNFKRENEIEDYIENGILKSDYLPVEFHELFMSEFDELLVNDTDEENTRSNRSLTHSRWKTKESQNDYTPWKEIMRRHFPGFTLDSTSEKRFRAKLKEFLLENSHEYQYSFKYVIPTGNRHKQYMIPSNLTSKFIQLFQEQNCNFNRVLKGSVKLDSRYEESYQSNTISNTKLLPFQK
jgi:hypothetical protein